MKLAIRGVAAMAVVGAMAAVPGAVGAQDVTLAGCIGLTCVAPGSSNDVPEARRAVSSVAGPESLLKQDAAGFYEFGSGTYSGRRAVAYVVPDGQVGDMPASVRSLPVVRATFDRGGFAGSTVVIFESEASLSLLNDTRKAAAVASRKRVRARASADAYGCNDNYFCLYSSTYWVQAGWPMVQFGPNHAGQGFKRLGDYGFNDMARSMRNRRDRDSLLAEHWNGSTGTGTRYCADSHSSDTTFENNAIGNAQASAFANVPDDIHC